MTQHTKSSVEHTSADLSILHTLDTHGIRLMHSFLAGRMDCEVIKAVRKY